MKISKLDFYGNPNIGLYAYATDKYCLLGHGISQKYAAELERILQVPVYRTNIAGMSLIGVMITGNKNCLLVPKIVFDEELKQLENLGIKYKIVGEDLTALGNNILCNDNGAVINYEYSETAMSEIRKALGVETVKAKINSLGIVGSAAAMNSKAGIVHPEISQEELKLIEKTLGIKFQRTTVNFGNPFVSSGIIMNSNGLLMGDPTTTIEVMQIQETFME